MGGATKARSEVLFLAEESFQSKSRDLWDESWKWNV